MPIPGGEGGLKFLVFGEDKGKGIHGAHNKPVNSRRKTQNACDTGKEMQKTAQNFSGKSSLQPLLKKTFPRVAAFFGMKLHGGYVIKLN